MADLTPYVDLIAEAIYAEYAKRHGSEPPRTYLGASIIGKECERALWYDFRWASKEQFDGRMYRLFQSGHLAEPRLVEDLESIGVEVFDKDPATGRQFGFSDHGGHMRGHMDAAVCNVPGGGAKWHVAEFKTHSGKSFSDLKKHGVKKSKPTHYAQMQWYMGKSTMNRALYLAVNKDTDELYSERVEFDLICFEQLQAKAQRVIFSTEPPAKLSSDPKYYICNMCSHNAVCHGHRVPPVSCRTCVRSTAVANGAGQWDCSPVSGTCEPEIPLQIQRTGCGKHLPLPFLLTYADPVDATDDWVRFKRKDNNLEFIVGEHPPCDVPVYASAEISAAHDHRVIGDPDMEKYRQEFGAKVIG